ncbi:hypothetical protein ABZ403_13995 [Micromonospora zamorensis]|uniref:hypothetical protein n=1 Tax=Micromonospora zamorensis TaxID=709883 RepID=UPI0033E98531
MENMTGAQRRAAHARDIRRKRADQRLAEELKSRGWLVFDPDHLPRLREDFQEEVEEGTPECALAELGYLCVRAQRAAELEAALDNGEVPA